MNTAIAGIYQCFSLLGLAPGACLTEMEANGIPVAEALPAILALAPLPALTPALARARIAAALAQARPGLFPVLAELLEPEGIHPLSMLNWEGWDPDQALAMLMTHWRGPGRAPLTLVGRGRVACADLRYLPAGLRLQSLRLCFNRDLRRLPEGLEIQGTLECRSLGLQRIPAALFCGGNLILEDLPDLVGWDDNIRIKGDLVLGPLPMRGSPPQALQVEGRWWLQERCRPRIPHPMRT